MDNIEFNVGDIVKLKSGGPEMTIQSTSDTYVRCQWFAGKKLDKGSFPNESIIKVAQETK